jgi:peptidoglycan/xylan/chitin deacetylase (PgdA/CDA1 family)
MTAHLLVLGWHNVESSWCFPSRPGAGRHGLERQLVFLRRYASVVPLGDALRALGEGRPLPPRAVALSFDDGYRDNLRLAVPVLERLGLPATFFLVPELLSGLVRPWWEVLAWAFTCSTRDAVEWEGVTVALHTAAGRRAAFAEVVERLKRRDRVARDAAVEELLDRCAPAGDPRERAMFLDWAGARELAGRGFAVGSHSLRHTILSAECPEEQASDLTDARKQLEGELDVPVDLLAYPNGLEGDYDQATVAAAERAGYAYAATTLQGRNSPATPRYEIRRFVQRPERGAAGLAVVPLHPVRSRARFVSWPGTAGQVGSPAP